VALHPHLVRIAAIRFLNPAPLMWDFEHPPLAATLARTYQLDYTDPARCAANVLSGRADLGLIPIAALTPDLAIVPGCAIAALDRVRSIQLIVKLQPGPPRPGPLQWRHMRVPNAAIESTQSRATRLPDHALRRINTIAADTASLSSLAYAQILFRRFLETDPTFLPASADPISMLSQADAALLIGDPALLALQHRNQIEAVVGPCTWYDLAHEWTSRTGTPWVAAVWATRPESLAAAGLTPQQLTSDLNTSRDHGLANIDALVAEWAPRIALPPQTIHAYLTRNIHYTLDDACLASIRLFRQYAAETGILPPLTTLRIL